MALQPNIRSLSSIKPNWMSKVNLPTYNASLYLTSVDVWNNPDLLKNDVPILASGNAYLISQSGHTADFGIDNIAFTSRAINGSEATMNTSVSTIQFDLHEVLGFKLYKNLLSYIKKYNYASFQNSKFVLKMEFLGRNPGSDTIVKHPATLFFQMGVQTINASISAQGTMYNFICTTQSRTSLDIARSPTAVSASAVNTLQDYFSNVEAALNENEANIRRERAEDQVNVINKIWKIEPGPGMQEFLSQPIHGVGSLSAAISQQQGAGQALISIPSNTNIVSYLFTELNKIIPGLTERRRDARWEESIPKIIVTPSTRIQEDRDETTNQIIQELTIFADVAQTFEREPADTPAEENANRSDPRLQNTFFNNMTNFICKRYDYLYTGLNTEITNLELNINAQFFASMPPSFGTRTNESIIPQTTPDPDATDPRRANNSVPPRTLDSVIELTSEHEQTRAADQASVETTTDGTASASQHQFNSNETGFMNLNMDIKGDPYWLGAADAFPNNDAVNNTVVSDRANGDVLIAYLNYLPTQDIARVGQQRRGELDYLTSGIYTVQSISSRFQSGAFTQTIEAVKRDDLTTELVKNRMEQL